jgi:hypothetical protein
LAEKINKLKLSFIVLSLEKNTAIKTFKKDLSKLKPFKSNKKLKPFKSSKKLKPFKSSLK